MKALIADNHPPFRDAMAAVLKAMHAVGDIAHAGSFDDAVHEICAREPTLVVVDLALPGIKGLGSIIDLVNTAGPARVVVVTDGHPSTVHRQTRICGVAGLIDKSAPPKEMERALTMVLRGGLAFPETLAIPTRAAARPHPALTARQLKVLALLTKGNSNKLIAKDLNLSPNTVKAHVSEILRRLNVSSRTEAIMLAEAPLAPAA